MGHIQNLYKVKVSQLKPYSNNYNLHPRSQIEEIAKSIDRFGFLSPVLIDNNFNVIAGHGRIEAAKLCGLEVIPAVKAEGITESERRAYLIADNHIATHAEPDEDILKVELADLSELEDFDLGDIGFSDDELSEFFGEETKPDKEVDEEGLEDAAGEPTVSFKVPERLSLRLKSQLQMRAPEDWDRVVSELEANDLIS